jgi:hypothetical protein
MTHCPHCGKSLIPDGPSAEFAYTQNRWFDAFWQLYPRHVGKASALKAWRKAATSEEVFAEIMAGLKVQLPRMASTIDKSFIPHASTWLNGRRWEDEREGRRLPHERVSACELCRDTGTISSFPDADTMALAACSCARGALPGLMVGVYRVSTGERIGDAPAIPTSGDGVARVSR